MAHEPLAIQVTWDSRQVKHLLAALAPKPWAFATARALSNVAERIKTAEVAAMERDLDKPTRWTLNSLYTRRASPRAFGHASAAIVGFKDLKPGAKGTPA